jgi:aminoglycoside phosphotransferase (APT) family kinase protein
MQQPVDAPAIDEKLVNQLVASQFPHWSSLTVTPVQPAGWDNATFRLGDRMAVRLPRSKEYAPQVEKEFIWLPILAPSLPQRIPEPLALGSPTDRYPYQWSILSG